LLARASFRETEPAKLIYSSKIAGEKDHCGDIATVPKKGLIHNKKLLPMGRKAYSPNPIGVV
jgi:hypothetical protein